VFGLWSRKPEARDRDRPLLAAVAAHMPEADEHTIRIVAAIAGLLVTVAYADHSYAAEEEQRIRQELGRVQGLSSAGVDAICDVLREHAAEIAAVEAPWHARALRDLAEHELRLQVLDLLLDVAAADDQICIKETNLLRHTAGTLGLTQDDYNAAQARHRDKLRVLR
jgi:uncharacterized tellurite resistance protein B-like protein